MTTLTRTLVVVLLLVSASRAAGAEDVVKVGSLGITADAPVFIAIEKGYFRERGIDVKLEPFASAAPAMAPLSTGEIQVVGGGIAPALFNAFARDFPVRVVAHRTRDVDGNSIDSLMIRSDLKAGIRRLADLKGKKIAINAPGGALTYMVGKMLESDGLTLKDVELVYMSWPDMAPAFANKAIDAGAVVDPFVAQFEERGIAVTFKRAADVLRNPWWDVAVLLYNNDWARKNPRVATEFMAAYLKGARDMVDAMAGKNRAEIVDILVKHTRVKDRALYERMHWGYVDPNGAILKQSVRDQQDWYARQGLVPRKADLDEIIDERYVKAAIEKLGVYR
jgi:NitT/TauT family transport system substrate-binding protein